MSLRSETNTNTISTVELYYNNCILTPAPIFTFSQEPVFDGNGARSQTKTSISLDGTVLVLPSGSYEQMYAKQEILKNIFSSDYKDFVIIAGAGNKTLPSGTIICSGIRPKVTNITIEPDIHVCKFDYTVELEATVAASGVSGVATVTTNQWSFRENSENCTLELTHNVSAQGADGVPNKFAEALIAVKPLLGINKLPIDLPYFTAPNASGLFGLTHPSNPVGGPIFEFSHNREEVADVANGTYSVTETFTIVSGVPFFFSSKTASFQEDENGIATVNINGQVQGLGRTLTPNQGLYSGGLGFQRALSGFLNVVKPALPWEASGIYVQYKEAPNVSGLAVYRPSTYSVTQNPCQGTIDFSVSYTDNPANLLPSGIVSSDCNVSISNPIRLYASHVIPFRRLGNIIQDIKTPTEGTISIQCNVVAKNTGFKAIDINRAIDYAESEVNRLRLLHASPSQYISLRLGNFSQTIGDSDLSCSVDVNYIYTTDLSNTQSHETSISLRRI